MSIGVRCGELCRRRIFWAAVVAQTQFAFAKCIAAAERQADLRSGIDDDTFGRTANAGARRMLAFVAQLHVTGFRDILGRSLVI